MMDGMALPDQATTPPVQSRLFILAITLRSASSACLTKSIVFDDSLQAISRYEIPQKGTRQSPSYRQRGNASRGCFCRGSGPSYSC